MPQATAGKLKLARGGSGNEKYNLVSLFTGAGGLDLGFSMTGKYTPVMANELLVAPAETYSKNFGFSIASAGEKPLRPNTIYLGDIKKLYFAGKLPFDVDIVVGGPPCQDFSVVRGPSWDRRGLRVKRGRLYAQFARALASLQPKMFVFENVPGLISANNKKALEVILSDLSNLGKTWKDIEKIAGDGVPKNIRGYEVLFCGLVNASKLGVPQARRRLVIIGARKDLLKGETEAFSTMARVSLCGEQGIFAKYPLTALEALEGYVLPDLEKRYRDLMGEYGSLVPSSTLKKGNSPVTQYFDLYSKEPLSSEEATKVFDEHKRLLHELGYFGSGANESILEDGTHKILTETSSVMERLNRIPPGQNHEAVKDTKWEVRANGMSLIYRRLHPLKPSYTVVAYGGGGTWGYHYVRSRGKLTNRERARLQTFPDNFQFSGSATEVRAQLGEAVPPLLAKRIAEVCSLVLDKVCVRKS